MLSVEDCDGANRCGATTEKNEEGVMMRKEYNGVITGLRTLATESLAENGGNITQEGHYLLKAMIAVCDAARTNEHESRKKNGVSNVVQFPIRLTREMEI